MLFKRNPKNKLAVFKKIRKDVMIATKKWEPLEFNVNAGSSFATCTDYPKITNAQQTTSVQEQNNYKKI